MRRASFFRLPNSALWLYLNVAGFYRYLREIVSTNKLAGTWLDHIIEENFADRVAIVTFTVVKNSEEGRVKFIVENRIACLPDRAAEARTVSYDLKTGDVKLSIVLWIKRRIVKYPHSLHSTVRHDPGTEGKLSSDCSTLRVLQQDGSVA